MQGYRFLFFAALLGIVVTGSLCMASGETLQQTYKKTCGKCHSPYNPDSYSAGEWKRHVDRMASRAGIDASLQKKYYKLNTR
jgi:hypothetical protein